VIWGDHEDLPSGADPDDDEIMAELRQARREMMTEFNDDLAAFVARLQTRRDSDRQRGFREADLPRVTPNLRKPDAA
jgi:hypothetical protein